MNQRKCNTAGLSGCSCMYTSHNPESLTVLSCSVAGTQSSSECVRLWMCVVSELVCSDIITSTITLKSHVLVYRILRMREEILARVHYAQNRKKNCLRYFLMNGFYAIHSKNTQREALLLSWVYISRRGATYSRKLIHTMYYDAIAMEAT